MPMQTALRCPMCGAMNPVGNVYCDKCQARVAPMASSPEETAEEERPETPSIKGLSLPTIPLSDQVEEKPPASADESADDWLSQFRASTPDAETAEAPPTAEKRQAEEAGEKDDWLSQLRDTAPPDIQDDAPDDSADTHEESEGDWLTQLRATDQPESSEAPYAGDDWLTELRGEAPEETPPPAAPDSPDTFDTEIDAAPDWLQRITPERAEAPESMPWEWDAEAAPAMEPAAIPDWLQEIAPSDAPVEEPAVEEIPVEAAAEVAQAAPPPFEQEKIETDLFDETPDWLRDLAIEEEPSPTPTLEKPATIEAEPEIEAGEMPGWLADLGPRTETDGIEALAQAEIPAWMEGLRPKETKTPKDEEEALETEGLLEGLRGVLPPSEAIEQLQPQKRSHIETSEATLTRARLLQDLVTSAIEPPKPTPYKAQRKRVDIGEQTQRLVVALILLVTTLGALIAPDIIPPLSAPALPPHDPYETIENLDAGAAVLLVFEYGPTESDEMDAIAHPLISHLLEREASLFIAATRPEGSAAATGMLQDISTGSAYTQTHHTWIGYRPGNASGIAQILKEAQSAPQSAPQPAPQLIVVLTAQPRILRWWIEQTYIGDAHNRPPIVAGLSAALEPFASPYLTTSPPQLAGMLSGLPQAAAYEHHHGIAGDATHRLNGLTVGQIVIVGLIIVGAIPYAIAGRRRREEQ